MTASDATPLLRDLGATAGNLPELLHYCHNPYREPLGTLAITLPLADEAHVEAWRSYAEEAAAEGVAQALSRRLAQLRFPVREGISGEPAYQEAIRRGEPPPEGSPGPSFADPEGLELELHASPAGTVPILVARSREDFTTLVRALAGRSEPIEVPAAMGACLVKGLVNWDRVARHRAAWAARLGDAATEGAWQQEMRALVPRKELWQDRVLLLSSGPYSAVSAPEVGLPEDAWRAQSLTLRRDHELFHYLTLRLFGTIRSNLLDELLADLAGMLAARGGYEPELALRFLGLQRSGEALEGGRLEVYRGDPPLSAQAAAVLRRLAVAAVSGLGRVAAAHGEALADPHERATMLLALLAMGLEGLAGPAPEEQLEALRDDLRHRLGPAAGSWRMTAPANDQGVRHCLDGLEGYLAASSLAALVRQRLAMVADEMLTNTAKHAYPDGEEGEMEVTLRPGPGGTVELVFRDQGAPFNPLYQPAPETWSPLSERKVGGLGIFLVRRLAASLDYRREQGANELTVRLPGR